MLKEDSLGDLPPLHVAVQSGNCEIVKVLLENGANPDSTPDEMSPLYDAIVGGFRDIVELLIKYGANMEVSANNGISPLDFAAATGNEGILELILQNETHVNGTSYYLRALINAIANGHDNVIKLLLQNIVKRNLEDKSCLVYCLAEATKRGQCNIVELLRHNLKDVIGYWGLLVIAVAKGHLEIIQILLSYGTSLNILDAIVCKGDKSDLKGPLQLLLQVSQHLRGNCMCSPESMNVINVSEQDFSRERQMFDNDYSINSPPPGNDLHHLIKIIWANLYHLFEKVYDISKFGPLIDRDLENFKRECFSEVVQMKKVSVCDANITVFDILLKNEHQVARCLRNENFAQILNSDSLNDRFPKYGGVLKCQVRNGKQRLVAVEEGLKICQSISSLFKKLPREVNEKVMNYLSLGDLLILTSASPHTNV